MNFRRTPFTAIWTFLDVFIFLILLNSSNVPKPLQGSKNKVSITTHLSSLQVLSKNSLECIIRDCTHLQLEMSYVLIVNNISKIYEL